MLLRNALIAALLLAGNVSQARSEGDSSLRIQRNLKLGGAETYDLTCISDTSCSLKKTRGEAVIQTRAIKTGKKIIDSFTREIAAFAKTPNGPVPAVQPTFEWRAENDGKNLTGHTLSETSDPQESRTLRTFESWLYLELSSQ
ncbi:MAG: hypothetical protein ABL958_15925 [Bdellovibrionia bacterium]